MCKIAQVSYFKHFKVGLYTFLEMFEICLPDSEKHFMIYISSFCWFHII